MKRIGKEPRLLPKVMDAIAKLKEKAGSSQKKIIGQVSHIMKKTKDPAGNVTMQVRRALNHGLHSGLIKQRSGKYLLGLDNKDYAVFKKFRKVSDPLSGIIETKRRRRKGRKRRSRRRRRRRGRRHAGLDKYSDIASDSEEDRSVLGTPEPMDRGRRRRGRRRRGRSHKGRKRGRGRRRHAVSTEHSDSEISPSKKSFTQINKPEKRKSNDDKIINCQPKPSTHGGSRHGQSREYQDRQPSRNQPRDSDGIECGNPECLCNIKQEEDQPESRYMSHDTNNDFYQDDYLN